MLVAGLLAMTFAAAPLEVTFTLAPRPPGPPTLSVRVENVSATLVAFERFELAQCFADLYLEVTLTDPQGRAHQPEPCVVKSWPGTPAPLAPRAVTTRALPLAELFPDVKWSPGRYTLRATWNPAGFAGLRGDAIVLDARKTTGGTETFELGR